MLTGGETKGPAFRARFWTPLTLGTVIFNWKRPGLTRPEYCRDAGVDPKATETGVIVGIGVPIRVPAGVASIPEAYTSMSSPGAAGFAPGVSDGSPTNVPSRWTAAACVVPFA